jgi:hypothetical protein
VREGVGVASVGEGEVGEAAVGADGEAELEAIAQTRHFSSFPARATCSLV